MMTRGTLALALLGVLLMAGCLEPHRVHVPDDALAASRIRWEEETLPMDSEGWFGPKSTETRYRHTPPGDDPPFPGLLQVFSVRRIEPETRDELLARVEAIVDSAMEREHIRQTGTAATGTRTLASGVETQWFVRTGNVRTTGGLFDDDVEVMVLGEVGFDGRSRTEFLAVALVQVARTVSVTCPPVLPNCERLSQQRDMTTWASVAGDPDGSLGPTLTTGLVWNLETHA